MQLTSTEKIDVLNIRLMLFSCCVAILLPFELFLIAYAVLGPLHYLTEISWLHDRNYYTARKQDAFLLIVIGILYGATVIAGLPLKSVLPNLVMVAFAGSIVLAQSRSWVSRVALL